MFQMFQTKRSLFRISVCAVIALVFAFTFALALTLNDRGIHQTNDLAQEPTGRTVCPLYFSLAEKLAYSPLSLKSM
jgi:hypothetical protein